MQEEGPSAPQAQAEILRRLLAKDASLWSQSPEEQESIRNRLGWLDLHETMAVRRAELDDFAREVRARGYTRAVLLGMGGSSLAPEVFQSTFGAAPGYPPLTVLDTTDPASILALEGSIDPRSTLFIVSSKSGTTIETLSLFRYFAAKVRANDGGALTNFIGITDPRTLLEEISEKEGFWRCFLNPPDVGGRYSALSFFGLVPASIIGVNVKLLLDSARDLDRRTGAGLGGTLAELAAHGRDKITFLPGGLPGFGAWAEQLLAESTGKNGRGLIPVDGEPLGSSEVYRYDRVFVRLRLSDRPDGLDEAVRGLESAGHPVITPNVQEAKDATASILDQKLVDPDTGGEILGPDAGGTVRSLVEAANAGDYAAILAYIQRSPAHDEVLTRLRVSLRFISGLATTLGYGPRYLHSTGQLHKGGPDKGVFLLLTADDVEDLPIPYSPYGFSTLKRAQALGDLRALRSRGRRVLHVHLGADVDAGLARLLESVQQALSPAPTV
jgi:glucose-6-phosphate isomerase